MRDLFDGIAALLAASTTSGFDFLLFCVRDGLSQVYLAQLIEHSLIEAGHALASILHIVTPNLRRFIQEFQANLCLFWQFMYDAIIPFQRFNFA